MSVEPGGYAKLYFTGQGYVSPGIAMGAAVSDVPVADLSQPRGDARVLINGVQAQISFAGIPYGLVGVTQVNFIVPADTPLGDQPVTLSVGTLASNIAYLTVGP